MRLGRIFGIVAEAPCIRHRDPFSLFLQRTDASPSSSRCLGPATVLGAPGDWSVPSASSFEPEVEDGTCVLAWTWSSDRQGQVTGSETGSASGCETSLDDACDEAVVVLGHVVRRAWKRGALGKSGFRTNEIRGICKCPENASLRKTGESFQ